MAAPVSVRPTTESFLSALSVLKPEKYPDLIERYPGQLMPRFIMMMELAKRQIPTGNPTYSHYETNRDYPVVQSLAAYNAGGAGQSITITLAAASHDADGYAPVQAGMTVVFKDGNTGYVDSVTPTLGAYVMVVFPHDATVTLSVGINEYIVWVANQYAEGTGQPNGLTGSVTEFSNNTQIIKAAYEITGSANTDILWFKYGGKDWWTYKGETDTQLRFKMNQEFTLLLQQENTNTANITIANAGYNTRGLIPDVAQNGINLPHAIGNVNIPFFDNLSDAIKKQFGAREYMLYCGLKARQDVENFITNTMTNGAIVYGSFNGSSDLAIKMGFRSFEKSGYTFHLTTADIFSDPQTLGAPGFNYENLMLGMPMDNGKDPRTGNVIPSIAMRYKERPGYSRLNEIWFTGSAGLAVPTNQTDNYVANYRCEVGLETFGINRFFLSEGV